MMSKASSLLSRPIVCQLWSHLPFHSVTLLHDWQVLPGEIGKELAVVNVEHHSTSTALHSALKVSGPGQLGGSCSEVNPTHASSKYNYARLCITSVSSFLMHHYKQIENTTII